MVKTAQYPTKRKPISEKELVKRVMAEIRLSKLGYDRDQLMTIYGRNTLYKMLRDRGYVWSPKYTIWVKEEKLVNKERQSDER